jgi:hypothetical protein
MRDVDIVKSAAKYEIRNCLAGIAGSGIINHGFLRREFERKWDFGGLAV